MPRSRGKGKAGCAVPVIWGLIGVVAANNRQQPDAVVAAIATLVALVLLWILFIVGKKEKEERLKE
jgi:hypothetical protein